MTATAEPLTAPLHPTVLDALRNTPAAPLTGQPVAQVLSTIGLPGLPQPIALSPLPGMPALPALDMTSLVKPITDMFSGFGTGILGANGAVNPQSLLHNVIQGLSTAMQWGEQGLQLLRSMQGQGTQAAIASGVTAQGDSAAVSSQATQVDATLGAAATTVATGAAEMAAVAARLVATEALLAPLAATPGGQAALLAAAAEAAAEAAAITASTKAQLVSHSAAMTQAGSPVTVSGGSASTTGSSAQSALEQLMSGFQMVQEVAESLVDTAQHAAQISQKAAADPVSAPAGLDSLTGSEFTADSALIAGAAVPGTTERASLRAWQPGNVMESAATEPVAETTATAVVEEPLPSAVPVGGALAAIRPSASSTESTPWASVNTRHRDELVANDADDHIPAPVIGAITTEPTGPDIPFSL